MVTKSRLQTLIRQSLNRIGVNIPIDAEYYLITYWEERCDISDAPLDKFLKRENGTEYWATICLQCGEDEEINNYSPTEDFINNENGIKQIADEFYQSLTSCTE